jgi:methionyl-tRNA formyltransferase
MPQPSTRPERMRNVLVGAVESSRVALEALGAAGHPPVAVLTLPADRSGRHSDWCDLRPLASELGVPVLESADVNDPAVLGRIGGLDPDHVLVVGWSQICRPAFLALPRAGVIGYHPAPLPENRGRAVIPWTILQHRTETGGTLFWMDEGVDTGDVLAQERFGVDPAETAASLYAKHMEALSSMLAAALPELEAGTAPRRAQDHGNATWCARRTPADGRIDWAAASADVWTLVRASGRPYPGAFTEDAQGRRLTVWEAEDRGPGPYWGLPGQVQVVEPAGALVQCGDRGHVLLTTVQREGEDPRPASQVLRNHERLGVGP